MSEVEGEAYHKRQLELVIKERKVLQERLEALERENRDLRRSVFELSVRRSATAAASGTLDLSSLYGAVDAFVVGGAVDGVADRSPRGVDTDAADALRRSTLESGTGTAPAPLGLSASSGDRSGTTTPGEALASPTAGTARANTGRDAGVAFRFNLSGHAAAVYALAWSRCGRLLASGSFDRSIRVWEVERAVGAQCVLTDAHSVSVSDLCWPAESRSLLSTGFDHCVREWDVSGSSGAGDGSAHGKLVHEWDVKVGLLQCLALDDGDDRVIYAGSTARAVYRIDRRTAQPHLFTGGSNSSSSSSTSQGSSPSTKASGTPVAELLGRGSDGDGAVDAPLGMVNTLASPEPHWLIVGDSNGIIRFYDVRRPEAAVQWHRIGDEGKPIAHLQVARSGRYLAVNAFDDVLRLYDRGVLVRRSRNSTISPQLNELRALRGHRNGNMPLRCSMYEGERWAGGVERAGDAAGNAATSAVVAGNSGGGNGGDYHHTTDVARADAFAAAERHDAVATTDADAASNTRSRPPRSWSRPLLSQNAWPLDASLTVACASADARIYLYDCGLAQGELVQVLEGHAQRVYAVAFHPQDPILASCSADGTVKVWA
ncbi:hypothetical protein CDCA_CDCA19G4697 [Cyanidium caldarium]|uniref:Uncharacterized protein n=1 Tax=Cyanidium caldarium TaxID=2771 RepID=A0AAV9J288_CYACA|nr:hypothetical protein CDCA_CDCA19G4697 [Cyanidium caldarium]